MPTRSVHGKWGKRIGATQQCDVCHKHPKERVVYSCDTCETQLCRGCAADMALEAVDHLGVAHILDIDLVDWTADISDVVRDMVDIKPVEVEEIVEAL